jgi:hypothetical protein
MSGPPNITPLANPYAAPPPFDLLTDVMGAYASVCLYLVYRQLGRSASE